jgi:hypothetical protein
MEERDGSLENKKVSSFPLSGKHIVRMTFFGGDANGRRLEERRLTA